MARYPLIIRDQTYIILLQEGAKQGKTLGKFINEILNDAAIHVEEKTFALTAKRFCEECGEPADYEFFSKNGSYSYRCRQHVTPAMKKEAKFYRKIGGGE